MTIVYYAYYHLNDLHISSKNDLVTEILIMLIINKLLVLMICIHLKHTLYNFNYINKRIIIKLTFMRFNFVYNAFNNFN